MSEVGTLSYELLALVETVGELRHASAALLARIEALERRCAELEGRGDAWVTTETPVPIWCAA